jgi:hypothetical protein
LGMFLQGILDGVSKVESRNAIIIIAVFIFCGVMLLFSVKEDLRKQKFEREETEKGNLMPMVDTHKMLESQAIN